MVVTDEKIERLLKRLKKLRDKCEHNWQGEGLEGLGGYSEWRCRKCGLER